LFQYGGSVSSQFSPDWSRILNTADYRFAEDFRTGPYESEIVEWNLYDISDDQPSLLAGINASFVSWMPDSSHFAAEIPHADQDGTNFEITLFDQNGEVTDTSFVLPDGWRLARSTKYDVKEMAWSSDNRFLAFITLDESRPPIPNLYVADFQERKIIDLCIAPGIGLAWSPNSTQLALWVSDAGDNAIGVLDFNENQVYVVGYHDWPVIGWRTND
jgi:hypothetical protein